MKDLNEKSGRAYFQQSNNKEIKELKSMLASMDIELQKDAMKQIIASMTIGKDVSVLYPNVINCIRTKSIELKKLIYLYIINYSKIKPELSILGVASFSSDAKFGESPLIRGLAVRTMGCIQVDTIISYLAEILSKCLKDDDPYVRKTSALCVSKLFLTNPNIVIENGFINNLYEMLDDPNIIVVANSLQSLNEISTLSGKNFIKIHTKTLKNLLQNIGEANEWCQVSILDALINFKPKKFSIYEDIIEAVLPRLNHSNPSVVMGAAKLILKFMDNLDSSEKAKMYSKKISSSLISIMISIPEIKYVLLRGLYPIIQKRKELLEKEYKIFFIEYNDPIYLKLEKVDILYKLCDENNFSKIIPELKSYALTEINSELIQKSIRYIGYISIKYENAVDLCILILIEVFENNVDNESAVNESCLVARDIIRKYKGNSLELIKYFTSDLIINKVTDQESKSALIYLIGEFCQAIDDSTKYISHLIDFYINNSSPSVVKLQILNAAVKNFVNKPDESEKIVKMCLQKGAEESDDPDVRDRAYLYWRLLENEPDLAKEMLTSEKPTYDFNEDIIYNEEVVNDMIENLTNISSVYHIKSSELIDKERIKIKEYNEEGEEKNSDNEEVEKNKKKNEVVPQKQNKEKANPSNTNENNTDLLGLTITSEMNLNQNKKSTSDDLFNIFSGGNNNTNVTNNTNSNANTNNDLNIFEKFNQTSAKKQDDDIIINNFDFEDDGNEDQETFNEKSIPVIIFNDNNKGPKPSKNEKVFSDSNYTIYSSTVKDNNGIKIGLFIINKSQNDCTVSNMNIKKNSFGITIDNSKTIAECTINKYQGKCIIYSVISDDKSNTESKSPNYPFKLDCNLSVNGSYINLQIPFNIGCLIIEGKKLVGKQFFNFFVENQGKDYNLEYFYFNNKKQLNGEKIREVFERNKLTFSATQSKKNPILTYFFINILNKIEVLLEVAFINDNINENLNNIRIRIISPIQCINKIIYDFMKLLLE